MQIFGIIMHCIVTRKQTVVFAVHEAHCTALQELTLVSSERRYRSGKNTKIPLYVTLSRAEICLDRKAAVALRGAQHDATNNTFAP
jgi:riboflavin synthase